MTDQQQGSNRRAMKRDASPAAYKYWRGQVWPRRWGLLKDKGLWWPLAGALVVTALIGHLPAAETQINDVASALMDYSAIGLGACITALVLAIGLAPQKRVETWSTTYASAREYSAYSELIFVISWAATAQLMAAAVAWLAKLMGAHITLMPDNPLPSHVALLFGATAVVLYALWHLCTVISTLSMIGAVTIREAQKDVKERGEQQAPCEEPGSDA